MLELDSFSNIRLNSFRGIVYHLVHIIIFRLWLLSANVDSLLSARGGAFEHGAIRRMHNEFMADWDGFRAEDS